MQFNDVITALENLFSKAPKVTGTEYKLPPLKGKTTTPQLNRPGNRIVGRTITTDDVKKTWEEAVKQNKGI